MVPRATQADEAALEGGLEPARRFSLACPVHAEKRGLSPGPPADLAH